MSDEKEVARARIGPLLRQAHLQAHRAFAEALRPLGIEGRHFGVLNHLARRGPMSQRQLMDLSGEDKSAMVRTVDDLERLGLAARHPDPTDRRAYRVELTAHGHRTRDEAAAIGEATATTMLATFDPGQANTLIELLQRFVSASGPSAQGQHAVPSRSDHNDEIPSAARPVSSNARF